MPSTMSYKQAAWSLLLAKGVCLTGTPDRFGDGIDIVWSYSSRLDASFERTSACLAAIATHGIDWEATSEPADGSSSGFMDTFSSYDVYHLTGHLVTLDGTKWPWAVQTGSRWERTEAGPGVDDRGFEPYVVEEFKPMELSALIELLGAQGDIDAACATTRSRLNAIADDERCAARNRDSALAHGASAP